MSNNRSGGKAFVRALALVSGCLYAEAAGAQNGVCVVNTQRITSYCQGGCSQSGCACKSQTTITVPNGGYGKGVYYSSVTTQCCGSPVSYLANPDGNCVIEAPQRVAKGEKRLVFLRRCDGRLELYAIGG
jgi:hypothetical protein